MASEVAPSGMVPRQRFAHGAAAVLGSAHGASDAVDMVAALPSGDMVSEAQGERQVAAYDPLLGIEPHVRAALAFGREKMRQFRVPPRPKKGWSSTAERESAWIRNGAEALVQKLPQAMQVEMAGGAEALAMIGGVV